MADKKFLVKCYGKVKHLIKFNEFLSESETSMDNHWQNTYLFNKDILENKKCVDVGIWYGVSNAYAAESFNLKTTHGIDPNKNFIDICSQILPGIKVYETIDDLDEVVNTDVLFMLGLIPFFGKQWKEHLNKIFEKINAKYIILRHQTFADPTQKFHAMDKKEYNVLGLTDYSESANVDDVVWFLQENHWRLIKKTNLDPKLNMDSGNTYTFEKYGYAEKTV